MRRIMIAAPSSGSGKTMFTCGLLAAMKEQGKSIISYKCGPDYIDPMFHRTVIGVPSLNLDTFFQTEAEIKYLLKQNADRDFAVIEGVMGLYDGLGGTREEGSAYHLAKMTGTPIVLVMDAHGMGRTLISLLKGIVSDDTEHLIRGVILNRTSKAFAETLTPLIESETGLKVLGILPKLKNVNLESRHLGLKLPGEVEQLQEQLKTVADSIREFVQLEELEKLAEQAAEVESDFEYPSTKSCDLKLAVARDEAFCFYYEQNLECFRKRGVQIVEFSPLHDAHLPDCDGLLFGGGYPELCAKDLSENQTMLADIRRAIEEGIPSLAECGGFMYLHDWIDAEDGNQYALVGAVKGETHNTGKLCRFGYVVLETPLDLKMKAHEFHYYDSSANGSDCIATKPTTGKRWDCIHLSRNESGQLMHCWGFPHLYYPSSPKFVEAFVERMKAVKTGGN